MIIRLNIFSWQELAYCSPKSEICVENQTLKNQKCLVPCEGLYADITDDFLSQNILKMSEELTQINGRPHAVHIAFQQRLEGKMQ